MSQFIYGIWFSINYLVANCLTFFSKPIDNFYVEESTQATPPREIACFSIFLLRRRLFKDQCIGLHFHRVISGCEESPPLLPLIKNRTPDARRDAKYLDGVNAEVFKRYMRNHNSMLRCRPQSRSRAIMNENYYTGNARIILQVHKFLARFLHM